MLRGRCNALTSPSSEQVKKRLGDDSVTILFTRSACDLYTLAFVFPSLRYLTPLYMFWNLCPRPVVAIFDPIEDSTDIPLYSISKTRTSASPAAVTSVWSLEWGMNLTENMLARWPVATVVVRAKGATDESGWYVWILRCWSSLPEARSLPDVDQLQMICQYHYPPSQSRQPRATCLNALTHPECPPSSLTMSKSLIQHLSPYTPLTAE